MKKILLYAAMVLLSVTSCLKFEDAEPLSKVTTGAPTIEISAVGDSTFTATVTPAAGTNFYSYAILKGGAKAVSADNLLKVKVGSDIAEGYCDVKSDANKTVVAKGLMPNTDYTVYAVATSEQGQVTEVTAVETHTSDGLNPTYKAESKDGAATLTFSENVKLNKEGKAYATYYKVYNPEDDTTIVVPTSEIIVKGNVVTFPVIDTIPGAYVIYTWEKGLFKDGVDSVAAGNSVNTFGFDKDGKVDLGKSVGSRIPTEAWDLTWTEENKKGDTLVYFSDPASVVPVLKNSDRVLSYIDEEADWVVKVRHNYNGTEYLYPVSTYTILNDTTFAFMLDEEPEFTTTLDFMVAEGVLFDEYGNPNNAFEREAAYMRLLASTGIEGVYSYTWNGYSLPLYIEEVDDTTALVYGLDPIWVINADIFGNAAYGPLKAKYDKTKGTLSIAYGQTFAADANLPMLGIEGWNFSFLGLSEEGNLIQKGNFVIDVLDNGCLEASGSFILYELEEDDYVTNPVALKDCLYIKMSNTFEDPTAVASKASPMAKSNYVEVRKF